MIKIVAVLMCFFIFMANAYAISPDTDRIKEQIVSLESSSLKYNLGNISNEKIVKKTIKIKNKLNEPLKIKEAKSSCECLEVNLLPQTVKRNGIFEIEIIFDARGSGGQTKSIVYILTDNMNYELIRLEILSNVK